MTEEKPSQSGRIALGALSAIVIALVGVFFLPAPEEPQEPPTPGLVTSPEIEPAPPATETAIVAPAPDAAPDLTAEPPDEPLAQIARGPQFDTFRIENDGTMLIAGRADPGQVVVVILAGKPIEKTVVDSSGAFVIFADAGPSDVPRRLSLIGDPEGAAIASDTSYMVAPIRAPQVAQAPIATTPPSVMPPAEPVETADLETPAQPALAPPGRIVARPPAPPAPPPTPTVLQTGVEGITVVQTAPQLVPNVALDAITYAPDGAIALSGRATSDGSIQVYLDNRPVTVSPVDAGGGWRTDLPDVDTGVYTLRIDEVDAEGTVVSRVETPFKREEPADVAAVLAEETARDGFDVAVKTVQPGSTLWAIAEENLGKGIFYVAVFEANRDLIKDPDLIYPGQIFRIPEMPE